MEAVELVILLAGLCGVLIVMRILKVRSERKRRGKITLQKALEEARARGDGVRWRKILRLAM